MHMRIAVLGTGVAGRTLAGKLVESGHDVVLGSRTATNEAAVGWAAEAGPRAKAATFFDAAAEAEVVINATPGAVSLEVLAAASTKNLAGKVLIDVANPLDHSAASRRHSPSRTPTALRKPSSGRFPRPEW
jgi:8-hydroxy-5-deazaflavin:NADPH oxidoreductase